MPWRLFFSIFKEALPFITLSFFILTTLVFIQQVGKSSNLPLLFHISAQVTSRFLLSLLPNIVIITLPISLLVGTVITCSRLSADGELTAAQSLSVGKFSLALPFITLGLLGTLLTFYLSAYVTPRAIKDLKALKDTVLIQEARTRIKSHTFIDSFPGVLLYVQDVDPRTGEWLGVFILQQEANRDTSKLLTSARGQLTITTTPKITLEAALYNGVSLESKITQNTSSEDSESQAVSKFDKFIIQLSRTNADNDANDSEMGMSEMTLSEVARAAREVGKDQLRARVEWHRRLAFSFASLTLTCVTFIIAIRGKRVTTRPRTVIVILFVAMAFYLLLIGGQNLANSGSVPAWLGPWISTILVGSYVIKSFITNKQYLSAIAIPAFFSWVPSSLPLSRFVNKKSRPVNVNAARRSSIPSGFSILNLINYLIVSEITKYFLLTLLALVVTSIIFTLFDLIPSMVKSGTSIAYAMSYLTYLTPQMAYHVTPFAMLVAILLGCSVLTRTNQLVVIASAGQSKIRSTTAILVAALTLGFGLWFFSDYLLPYTNKEQDIRYHKIKNKQLDQSTIAFGKKWVFGTNNIIYSYQRIESNNSLINASIYYLSPKSGVIERATHFGEANQLSSTSWRATNGWIDVIEPDLEIDRKLLENGNQVIRIDDGPSLFKRIDNESSKMPSGELSEYIRQLAGIGIATTDYKIDLLRRVAFPFSCITLALLAMPFAITKRARRSTPMSSISLGVGISLIFWLLMTFFEAAAKQASLPVTLAVWGPQILLLAFGMYLNFRYRSQ
jgi:lipopolysaccharide export system permease protein